MIQVYEGDGVKRRGGKRLSALERPAPGAGRVRIGAFLVHYEFYITADDRGGISFEYLNLGAGTQRVRGTMSINSALAEPGSKFDVPHFFTDGGSLFRDNLVRGDIVELLRPVLPS